MASKKNHDRSPDKKGFSIALPIKLIQEIEAIAKEEHRSRNGQIEYFLSKQVKEWMHDKRITSFYVEKPQPASLVADDIGKYKHLPEIFLDHVAAGSPILTDGDTYQPTREYGPGRYACQLHGDSMAPRFPDGSIVILRTRESLNRPVLRKKEIYSFIAGGQKTLKMYMTRPASDLEIAEGISYRSSSGVQKVRVLKSINPDFPEMVVRGELEWTGWLDPKDNQS